MEGLKGRVAVVVGATSGIGRATAVALGAEGAKVAVAGRRFEAAQETARLVVEAGGEALPIAADVAEPGQVEAMMAQVVSTFGRIDLAVNNAGVTGRTARLANLSLDDYHEVFRTNVQGLWLCLAGEIRQMLAQGDGGAIVNTSSIQGHVALGYSAHYTASKHAIEGYTKAAAVDYARKGIRVNAVAPGVVLTDMIGHWDESKPEVKAMLARYPAGRVAEVGDIVGSILFLLSDASRYLNGISLPVDGGFLAG